MSNPMNRRGTASYQGMKWIRSEKRLAIYVRDGLACVYCGEGVEDGAKLTLDHLTPFSLGGGHEATNLVTACVRCNSKRGNRTLADWVGAVAAYNGTDATDLAESIDELRNRPLDVASAKSMIASRGFRGACRA